MRRFFLSLIITISTILTMNSQSVGLVLSGGGAKGIAHIGVIQALEDNNIPIDYIAGTSMGAIVGGLYASGYTPTEMMNLLMSRGFVYWSTGQIDENLIYYYSKLKTTPAMVRLNLNLKDSVKISSDILPNSLINPLPMNFAFMELFAPYTAQCGGNFNNLFVPFRCVASDVYQKHKIVCSSGSLANAIRASMSFPIVFKPIKLNGVFALDGGIYDNFPIDVMRQDFAPEIMIGVDVSSGNSKVDEGNLIAQVEAMIMQPQNDSLTANEGIKLAINLQEFGLLDFPKAQAIYQIGYNKAMSMMDSIKARIKRRIPTESLDIKRSVFKSQTPYLRFESVNVTGGNKEQNDYLSYIFDKDKHDTISIEKAKISYYRAISSGKIKDLLPQESYNKETGLFDLNLDAKVNNNFTIGLGGYISSSTSNMLYISAGYRTLSFNSFDASIKGWVGQSYYAGELDAKVSLLTMVPSALRVQGVIQSQHYYQDDDLFYNDQPTSVIKKESFVRLKYDVALGRSARLETGVGYGYLEDSFYPNNIVNYNTAKDESVYKLGQILASVDMSTLNHPMYPTSGRGLMVKAMGIYGNNKYKPTGEDKNSIFEGNSFWGQIEIDGSKYWSINKHWSLGGRLNSVMSTKKLTNNYTATIVQASAFMPTPATQNYFNPGFRANSFVGVGVIPIWEIIDKFQLRSEFYFYMPFQKIVAGVDNKPVYGSWFSNPGFIGETAFVYNFPFASLSLYGNYLSYPARNWNCGISLGFYIQAPKFLR